MAHSPSQTWEDGKLTERAKDARGESEENTATAVTGRPNDIQPIGPTGPVTNTTFAERAKARQPKRKDEKAVQEAENKAVSSAQTKGRK